MMKRIAKVTAERIQTLLPADNFPDTVSIEHVAALSGDLASISGQSLKAFREHTQFLICESHDVIIDLIVQKLEKFLSGTPEEGVAGARQKDIQNFAEDYLELLQLRLYFVPLLSDGRAPSELVPHTSVRQEALRSFLGIPEASRQRRGRHVLQEDEQQRQIMTRGLGSVPLPFTVALALSYLCLVFWLTWASAVERLLIPLLSLLHINIYAVALLGEKGLLGDDGGCWCVCKLSDCILGVRGAKNTSPAGLRRNKFQL
jgi:hypothetical protein